MPSARCHRSAAVLSTLVCLCPGCGSSFTASDVASAATSDASAHRDATTTGSNIGDTGAGGANAGDTSTSSDGSRGARDAASDGGNRDAPADATTMCSSATTFGAPMLVHGGANSPDDDLAPRLSSDELDIYFARRPANNLMAASHVYVAKRATRDAAFDVGVALAINSSNSDADPMIAADGLTLVFSSDRPNGSGEFDLYWSHRATTNAQFTSASPVPTVNSPGSELHPFLASDGELWFAYRPPGQDSALHLRRAPRAGMGFSSPVTVAELDSPTDDMWPVLTNDKLTVYFSSSRVSAIPQGKANVWTSRRSSPIALFEAPDIVVEVNSPATDLAGWISPDNCRLYLASNRDTGRGYEIYVASR